MKKRTHGKRKPEKASGTPITLGHCEEIRPLLTAFVTKELSNAQSALVWEHLNKCPECRDAARQIKKTMDLLRAAEEMPSRLPTHLSADRRARIMRAYARPLVAWLEINHLLIIGLLVMVLLSAAFGVLMFETLRQPEDREYTTKPVELMRHSGSSNFDVVPAETGETTIIDLPAPDSASPTNGKGSKGE